MEIRIFEKFCILTPLSPQLNAYECGRLYEEIQKYSGLSIGIDLTFVQDCTIEFIEGLYRLSPLNIFNISSDVFALFNMMKVDKRANLFVNEQDFIENKHRIINRQFSIV